MVYNKKNINFGCEFYLENKYFDSVIAEMKEIINETGLKLDGNILSNENKSVKIEYSEERQMYTLAVADITDGNVGEYREISSWLFDDTQTKKDAECVGMDFAETLRKEFGIASQKRSVNSLVDLPTAQKGDEANINAFTKKMLDVFPALKDEYKAHVAHYGNFLYLNFFGEHLVPRIIRLFEEGNRKQIKKFFDVIEDFYIKGDSATINTIVALLAAAAYKNDAVTAKIKETLADNKHFLNSFVIFLPFFAKNKKLLYALVKGDK